MYICIYIYMYKIVYLATCPEFVRWMVMNWYSVILNKMG